jgi:hypothetical protein
VKILGGRRILEKEDESVRMRMRMKAKVVKEPSTLRLLGVLGDWGCLTTRPKQDPCRELSRLGGLAVRLVRDVSRGCGKLRARSQEPRSQEPIVVGKGQREGEA